MMVQVQVGVKRALAVCLRMQHSFELQTRTGSTPPGIMKEWYLHQAPSLHLKFFSLRAKCPRSRESMDSEEDAPVSDVQGQSHE